MRHDIVIDALADATRRKIFEQLRAGPSAVGRLAESLPVSRPAVSQHLKVLKSAGLVAERREGTRNIYRIAPDGLADLRAYLETFWDDVLGRYAEAAQSEARTPRRKAKGKDHP